MLVDQRKLNEVTQTAPDVTEIGWFAARQPGILWFLETRLGVDTDGFAVALDGAWRICSAFERTLGIHPARLRQHELEQAERHVLRPTRELAETGWARRQPELCEWISQYVHQSPWLANQDSRAVALCLAAIVQALDHNVCGVAVPARLWQADGDDDATRP